ncbi:MAG: pilus assembly protein TadG-related protein [Clostridiaceae bacterium]
MKYKKFLEDERGAVLPLVALFLMFVVFGISALVVDAGTLYVERRNMVAAADAGALAGARELNNSNKSLQDILLIAKKVAAMNGADIGTLNSINISGDSAILNDGKIVVTVNRSSINYHNMPYVEVTTNNDTSLFFAQAFGAGNSNVQAKAIASVEGGFEDFIFPLAALNSEFFKIVNEKSVPRVNEVMYFHDAMIDGIKSWRALLRFDGSGAGYVSSIIADRMLLNAEDYMIVEDGVYYIKIQPGWDSFNAVPGKLNAFEKLINDSKSKSLEDRKKYLTGYIPIVKDGVYTNSTSQVEVEYFAEFVFLDYFEHADSKGIVSNYKYSITDNVANVNYNVYSSYTSGPTTSKTMSGYFTGKFYTIEEVYGSVVRVFLIE